ncbi:MAG: NmrA family NAD(P)-binding protein [Bdellovibrionota bacterium]
MNKETVLVIGASGLVGSEVVKILKSEGVNVRAATSKPAADASQVQLNLATGEGINKAFEGVERAFLLAPPGYDDQYALLSPLIQEAKRRGLKKVVLMTALGANASNQTPFRRAEIELEKSGLTYNIVRPNWFMQNFNTFWIQGILQQGKIFLPAGKAKTSFINAKDISAVVAKLLVSNKFDNQAFDITGPESLDHDEVAQKISRETGKGISYSEITSDAFMSGLIGAGLPQGYAKFLVLIMSYLREGYNAAVNGNVKAILGREPLSFEQYTKENRATWK